MVTLNSSDSNLKTVGILYDFPIHTTPIVKTNKLFNTITINMLHTELLLVL